jgi:hypothetical protein
MALTVSINGVEYTLPEQNENPSWGEELSDLLQALIDSANLNTTAGDISTTSFSIPNVAAAANVVGVSFDTSSIRSAIISYSIYRNTSTTELSECGQLLMSYKSVAGTFEIANYSVGNSQVAFSLTSGGQLQVTPTVMGGTGYVGNLKISAKVYLQ